MKQTPVRSWITRALCLSLILPSVMPITLQAKRGDSRQLALPAVARLAQAPVTRRLQVIRNGTAVTGASQLWSTANNPTALVALVSLSAGDLLRIDYSGRNADVIQANDTSLVIYKI